jgi:hypothetical protein
MARGYDQRARLATSPDTPTTSQGNLETANRCSRGTPAPGAAGIILLRTEDDATFSGDPTFYPSDDPTLAGFDRIGGPGDNRANALLIQPNGKSIVAGRIGTPSAALILRMSPNGFPDLSFHLLGSNAFAVPNAGPTQANALALMGDGRIVVAGSAGNLGAPPFGFTARIIGRVDRPVNLSVGGAANGFTNVYAPTATGVYANPPARQILATVFPAFAGDVRTASGDVNGDGVEDTVLVTGPGTKTMMAVVSGKDGSVLVPPTDPFGDENFTFGGFVTAGDIDGDGRAEWVVTPELRGGPRVVIFRLAADDTTPLVANFFGIQDDSFATAPAPHSGT